MSTAPQTTQPAVKNQNRRKKVRAVMASGLVLGVGAAVTLAAWSDTVWGEGTFGTQDSAFNIQGYFDEGWNEYVSSEPNSDGENGPGTMSFTQNANSLIPGEPVYQLVGLRETEGKLGADITLTREGTDTSDLGGLVSVAVAELAATTDEAPTCDDKADFGTATAIGTSVTDPVLTTDVAAGGYRWVCFSATLSEDATVDVSNVVSQPIKWQFTATSQDPAPAA
ncbi:SipW-dependent-type signal peptide-containing protein [Dietzia maris]|uniref:SipW-dependent-type signal peptide-containing protein n=1 Tax=Dietzia maris TaxID=37915 RepID=UPI00223C240C|nr:SipW-dependent-type signal peptide-containing protein [Dietzia maris]MCT1435232.1 SipW-dependent-type signal peptide-containing protein [Dietzia maris]MCT1522440.1 SipW-dependent-type signal peptide-containing protein [Dietzia maris]